MTERQLAEIRERVRTERGPASGALTLMLLDEITSLRMLVRELADPLHCRHFWDERCAVCQRARAALEDPA